MEILVKDIIKEAISKLEKENISDADIDSWLLLEYLFGITRHKYYCNPNLTLDEKQKEAYFLLIDKRAKKIPLQHITGTQEFMGLSFIVNENVLIPRQDTEILVEQVVKYIGSNDKEVSVLDMCTGSGCIAISIDKLCKNAIVTGADISNKALQVAKKNNENNNTNVSFIETDLFEQILDKYDIIVSNPPYICSSEIENLMEEVKSHEPIIALDGSKDGLKFYRSIIEQSDNHLNVDGKMFFEIGYDQGQSVPEILKQYGFNDIQVIKDLSGNDRVVIAGKE